MANELISARDVQENAVMLKTAGEKGGMVDVEGLLMMSQMMLSGGYHP